MKVNRIQIKELFGHLDYNLDLDNLDLCIITGPNGYGKTILLKIINNALNGKFYFFEKLLFNEIVLTVNHIDIRINKIIAPLGAYTVLKSNNDEVNINIAGLEVNVDNEKFLYPFDLDYNLKNINYRDFETFYDIKEGLAKQRNIVSNEIDNLFLDEGDVLFIMDQRIFEFKRNKQEAVLHSLSEEMKSIFSKYIYESNVIAQKLDGSFPLRVFERENKTYNLSMLKERLYGLTTQKEKYISYGLLDESSIDDEQLSREMNSNESKEKLSVLELYLEDSLEKFKPYEFLLKKVKLFEDMVNKQGLAFKEISVHRDHGILIRSTNKNKETIELSSLSSGEQNQIILLYNLIFKTNTKSLVLIDEPEISLHVAWQTNIVKNLENIKQVNNIEQFIIATHSPHVIDGNWKITLDLFESRGKK
ncbi:AAA family ATPase [Providencia manganoxydans]|uniref:AAA family ATPase n=1 Tax=Providencia manganoxydans TaxID=2923283 RepID=UPI0032DB8FAC